MNQRREATTEIFIEIQQEVCGAFEIAGITNVKHS
jgi:hypothetical protein